MSFLTDVTNSIVSSNSNGAAVQAGVVNTLFNQTDFINDLTTKYILKPLGAKGIAGFVFDIEREHRIELKSEITDHYIEDNSTIQDHISKAPVLITLTGYVGEIYNAPQGKVNDVESMAKTLFAEAVKEKLTDIAALLPPFNNSTITKAQQSANQKRPR